MIPFKKILVPVDFGPASNEALTAAVELAKRDNAELELVHVWEIPAYSYAGLEYAPTDLMGPIRDAAQAQLAETLARVRKELPRAVGTLKHGAAWQEVLGVIESAHPDLVIMGTHGRKGVRRMLLGSVAEKIVRTSPVPVLTMHGSTSVVDDHQRLVGIVSIDNIARHVSQSTSTADALSPQAAGEDETC